jgi:hypothetical protein
MKILFQMSWRAGVALHFAAWPFGFENAVARAAESPRFAAPFNFQMLEVHASTIFQ